MKIGVYCEFKNSCGLLNPKLQTGSRICNGDHTFVDYSEKDKEKYTQVIELPKTINKWIGGMK